MLMKVFAAIALLFIGSAVAEAEGCKPCHQQRHHHHHRKPQCCGCEGNPRFQVKQLEAVFAAILQSGQNLERINEFFTPDATSSLIAELCDNDSCCKKTGTFEQVYGEFLNRNITFISQEIRLRHDGSVVVEDVQVASLINVDSIVIRSVTVWVPTEGCNFKIASLDSVSFACDADITTLCSSCRT